MHDLRLCNAENLSAFYADLNARIATRIIMDLETPGIDPNRLYGWIDLQGHVTDTLHESVDSADEIRHDLGYDPDHDNGDTDGNPGTDDNDTPPACNCIVCRVGTGLNEPVDLGGGIRMQRIDPADLPKELRDILSRRFGIREPAPTTAPAPAPETPNATPTEVPDSRAVHDVLDKLVMLQKYGWITAGQLGKLRDDVIRAVEERKASPSTDQVG
jgi:hypothetical protein